MARSFTETEKDNIRRKLIDECEKSWAAFGYKKTNIDELCAKAGISNGAFYLFYDSKELLFCDLLDNMQERHRALLEETLSKSPDKADICKMIKQMYLEYDKTNILTQRSSSDFANFLNRAPAEWKEKSKIVNDDFVSNTIFSVNLKLKMNKEKAIGIFNALLAIVTNKNLIGYDHFEIFCTLLDNIINEIYE